MLTFSIAADETDESTRSAWCLACCQGCGGPLAPAWPSGPKSCSQYILELFRITPTQMSLTVMTASRCQAAQNQKRMKTSQPLHQCCTMPEVWWSWLEASRALVCSVTSNVSGKIGAQSVKSPPQIPCRHAASVEFVARLASTEFCGADTTVDHQPWLHSRWPSLPTARLPGRLQARPHQDGAPLRRKAL